MKTLILTAALLFQPDAPVSVIRSVKFENFKGISMQEVQSRFKDRGVRVVVEQFYEPQQMETGRQVLRDLLAEKGRKGVEVKAEVRKLPPRSVEIIFRAVKEN